MASLDSSARLDGSLSFGNPRLHEWSDHDSEHGGTHSEPELLERDGGGSSRNNRASLDTRLTRSTQLISMVGSGRKRERLSQSIEDGLQVAGGFTSVETPLVGVDTFGDDITAKALEQCKMKVLKPYHIFLKTIGFRRFKPIVYDIVVPWYYRLLNGAWPILLCIFLIASCCTQILLCFGRDKVWPGPPNDTQTYIISCKKHFLTSYLIPDVLLMVAYVYSLFVFRMVLPEHLTTLMETVFLGIISRNGKYSHKQLTRTLQFIGLIGLLWTIYSLSVSILRVFAEKLADPMTTIDWIPSMSLVVRIVLLVISIIGFIGFDMAYTAVILNYSIECQLMIYYLKNICQRILAKEWEIDQAIREINNARQFLSTMNRHLSRAVSIMLLLFLTMSVMSLAGLQGLENRQPKSLPLVAITGCLACFQWSFMLFLPIVQAARVSRAGKWLVKTSLEIRSRPYSYKDTPQLELDSFITYATSVDFRARLVGVPITPMIVILGAFILTFVLFLVFQYDQFIWASWL